MKTTRNLDSAVPFADASRLAHVALARYKTKANKKLPWMRASREFLFALFCTACSSRRLSLGELLIIRKCCIFSIFKSSCCLPVVYGRKLRTTVHNWWQLYICFFPIPFVFTNRNCRTHNSLLFFPTLFYPEPYH